MFVQGSHSISKMKFTDLPRLCSALFPDPSEVRLLVLCNFSWLLLALHWVLSIIILLWNALNVYFHLFQQKLNNSHATQMMHIIFPWPSTKFPEFWWSNQFIDFPGLWEPWCRFWVLCSQFWKIKLL